MGITFGSEHSADPSEMVVVAHGNRLEAPPGRRVGPSLLIRAANYNNERIVNRKLDLPSKATAEPTRRREATRAVELPTPLKRPTSGLLVPEGARKLMDLAESSDAPTLRETARACVPSW